MHVAIVWLNFATKFTKSNYKYTYFEIQTMSIMYVDDSGSPSYKDHTNYFILAGIIVNDNKIKDLQKTVFEYKHANFVDEFIESEIHVHHIYKSKGDFRLLVHKNKIELLDKLYAMISILDCVGIIITINKRKLQKENPKWDVFNTAWSFLLDAYEIFLQQNSVRIGKIKVDKSSNKTQRKTDMIIRAVARRTSSQSISKIIEPTFADSSGVFGIQIADALAYCALKHNMNDVSFNKYWDVIYNKLAKRDLNTTPRYGHIEYP